MPQVEFPCPRPVTVSARLAGGSLEVVAEERTSAAVTVEPYDGSGGSREAVEHMLIDMSGDTLRVEAPEGAGRGWGRRGSSRVRVGIRVPTGGTVELRSASADLTCHGRYGTASVTTASGTCFVERVTGDASVESASGDLRLDTVDGQLRAKSASGDVSVRRVGGDSRVDTASGDIEVGEAAGDLRAGTASGTIRVDLVRRGAVRVDTVSGDASVAVARGTGVWLDVSTLSGSTSNDLQVGAETPPSGHDLTLKIRTVSGDIDVRRAAADATPAPAAATDATPPPAPATGATPAPAAATTDEEAPR